MLLAFGLHFELEEIRPCLHYLSSYGCPSLRGHVLIMVRGSSVIRNS